MGTNMTKDRPLPARTLVEFQKRRQLWIQCMGGEDRNSIQRQIHHMLWNTAAFTIVNEAWRIAPPAKGQGRQINGLVHRLVVDGFVADQVLAVRRLTDCEPIQDTKRKRAVYSLIALLEDLRANTKWMTRVHLLESMGLNHEAWPHTEESEHGGLRDLFWDKLNRDIDTLAAVKKKDRTPGDAVREGVFDRLMKKVTSSCGELMVYANKFLAHAADPESRQDKNADKIKVTLNHFYHAQEAICGAANFLSATLLDGKNNFTLASPQYDHLKYIDSALVTSEGLPALHRVWKEYEELIENWTNWGIDGLRQELDE
jgi:hypothetical protein